MTDEKLAELHATAAERADSLMDKPTIAGSQPYVTEPKPYHADALTPANHVPGNVISLNSQPPADNAHVADGCELFDGPMEPVQGSDNPDGAVFEPGTGAA